MSDLLALCFDVDATPALRFQESRDAGPERPRFYGWGVGWYPNSEGGASVLKDPRSSGGKSVGEALGDWENFRATIFLSHLRGHNRPRTQQDTQPFVRSYGGRQWIFAHDGDLAPDYPERLPLPDDPAFEPLGRTDSEHAFCWILARLRETRARALADVDPTVVHAWLSEVNAGGRLNVLISDGDLVLAYRDAQQGGALHWTRRIPPHARIQLVSPAVSIDLGAPKDLNRTCLIFSSEPLSPEGWLPLAPGQLVLARRGAVVWDSAPGASEAASQPPGTLAPRLESTHQIAAAEPLPVPRGSGAKKPVPTRARSRVLRVVHETHYEYSEPVERSDHRLLLRPLDDRHQRLLAYQLELSPAGQQAEYEDVFGNDAVMLRLSEAYTRFTIRSTSRVRTEPPQSFQERMGSRRESIPLTWMPWQSQMLSAYLLPPELPETQLQELSEFAMGLVGRNDSDLTGTLLDLNQTLYRDFEYVSASTTVATTPFEVFESRRGVCQDFANLMICLARLLQVPARYRMGYIHTGADYENKVQSDASHAWVELYVPRLGWHGFDPTNGRQVGSEHVRVACGRNYRDATPTSGTIYRGGGTETLRVSVKVEEE